MTKRARKIVAVIAAVTFVFLNVHHIEHFNSFNVIVDDLETIESLDIVKKIDSWKQGIRFAQWNNSAETEKEYLADWVDTLVKLTKPGKIETAKHDT